MSGVFNISTQTIDFTKAIEGCAYSAAGTVPRCPRCKNLGEKRRRARKRGGTIYRFIHIARIVRARPEKPGQRARNRFEIVSKCDVREDEREAFLRAQKGDAA